MIDSFTASSEEDGIVEQSFYRRDLLVKASLAGVGSTMGLAGGAKDADAKNGDDVILGLWSVHVATSGATYNYFYSFARSGYVATGDVDEKFLDMKFSPTMGAYVSAGRRSVRYRETGWTYDLDGKVIGTFSSVGTFTISGSGETLSGPGVFTLSDLKGKVTYTEHFLATGKKIAV